MLLAKAYEAQENKQVAVLFYKEALKANCEQQEAFDRLISNSLICSKQKEELLAEMTFNDQNLWLKDYYQSVIRTEIRAKKECEGHMYQKSKNSMD